MKNPGSCVASTTYDLLVQGTNASAWNGHAAVVRAVHAGFVDYCARTTVAGGVFTLGSAGALQGNWVDLYVLLDSGTDGALDLSDRLYVHHLAELTTGVTLLFDPATEETADIAAVSASGDWPLGAACP